MFGWFTATVVKVNGNQDDHDFAGDVQIRIESDQDDTSRLPDEKLRWARNLWPVTEAQHKGVGSSGAYLIPGTRVMGFFMDQDKQVPYIMGTMATVGKYGSLAPKGDGVARGLPGTGDSKEKSLLGIVGSRNLPDVKSAKEIMDELNLTKKDQKLKDKAVEQYGKEEGGNGPAKNGNLPHLGSKKEPAFTPDMIKYLKNINPKNLGGMISTIPAFTNIKKKTSGTVPQMIGQLPMAQLDMISSIVNMDASNVIKQMSKMFSSLNTMKSTSGSSESLSQLNESMNSLIPAGSFQSLAYNSAVNSLKTDSVDLSTLSASLSSISETTDIDTSDIIQTLNKVVVINSSTITVPKLLKVCVLLQQIQRVTVDLDESTNSTTYENYSIVVSYAKQLGDILNIGESLVSLAATPTLLIEKVKVLINEWI